MQALVLEGRVVRPGQMPDPHHPAIEEERDQRPSGGAQGAAGPSRRNDPAHEPGGNALQPQRPRHQQEEQMLDHVGAEKVLVPQHVERRDQSQEHHQRAQMETGLLPGRGSPIPPSRCRRGPTARRHPRVRRITPAMAVGSGCSRAPRRPIPQTTYSTRNITTRRP